MRKYISMAALVMIASATSASASPDWVIHEWGTFTSLQDENGKAIGGINTDDEAVPEFVHRLPARLLIAPTEAPPLFFKGAPHCDPDITMRMETPVIYFHPPAGTEPGAKVGVQVSFNGGWLSEYYPQAELTVPGLGTNGFQFGPLLASTVSTLNWVNLEIGGDFIGPKTDSRVWTSPRQVQSAPVRTATGEKEQFLFYRGVAHLNAPLKISREKDGLIFHGQLQDGLAEQTVKSLWLVDIQADGKIAYRTLPGVSIGSDSTKVLEKARDDFHASEYQMKNFDKLKGSLKEALVGEGLYADEAQALLNTWEGSYFKSPGLRVFFMVPRAWTDQYLPLTVSVPAKITRVMVGRIELVTQNQKKNLRNIAVLTPNRVKAEAKNLEEDFINILPRANGRIDRSRRAMNFQKLASGEIGFDAAGIAVPEGFQYYLNLGRFRNALVLDELENHPTEGLKAFIEAYNLQGYKPKPPPLAAQ